MPHGIFHSNNEWDIPELYSSIFAFTVWSFTHGRSSESFIVLFFFKPSTFQTSWSQDCHLKSLKRYRSSLKISVYRTGSKYRSPHSQMHQLGWPPSIHFLTREESRLTLQQYRFATSTPSEFWVGCFHGNSQMLCTSGPPRSQDSAGGGIC